MSSSDSFIHRKLFVYTWKHANGMKNNTDIDSIIMINVFSDNEFLQLLHIYPCCHETSYLETLTICWYITLQKCRISHRYKRLVWLVQLLSYEIHHLRESISSTWPLITSIIYSHGHLLTHLLSDMVHCIVFPKCIIQYGYHYLQCIIQYGWHYKSTSNFSLVTYRM